jgi:hypothetical protein
MRSSLFAVLVGVIFLTLAFGSGDSDSGGDSKKAADAAPMGDTVNIKGLDTTVLRASLQGRVAHSSGFMSHDAPSGAMLLIVRYRVVNTTNEPIKVSSFADYALDDNGRRFGTSLECSMVINTLGITDTLNPGIPQEFEACFEVPADATGWVIAFNRAFTTRFMKATAN